MVIIFLSIGLFLIYIDDIKNILNKDCFEFEKSFSIEDVCNLNENELKVSFTRGSDNINLVRLKLEFLPSKSLWKIDGSKCLDIRLDEERYGNYCSLIKEEDNKIYVFNHSLGLQDEVKIWAEDIKKTCFIGEREVRRVC